MLTEGSIPRISVKSDNNGILGYFNTINDYDNARHFKNFISVNFFGDVFYHPYEASVEMKVHVLKLPFYDFTQRVGIYLVGALQRVLKAKSFSYGNQLSSSKLRDEDFFITLPVYRPDIDSTSRHSEALAEESKENPARFFANTQNDKLDSIKDVSQPLNITEKGYNSNTESYSIAFDFMESYIAELEAYLRASGLSNYTLTKDEKLALQAIHTNTDSIGGGGNL